MGLLDRLRLPPVPSSALADHAGRSPRSLIGAAEVVNPGDQDALRRMGRLRNAPVTAWQRQALEDCEFGIPHYGQSFVSMMMSRIRWFPARRMPDGGIEPIESGPLLDVWDAVQGRTGNRSTLFARAGGLWYAAGEAWVTGVDGRKGALDATYEVHSIDELSFTSQGLRLIEAPGLSPIDFDPDMIGRLWWPSLRWKALADSPHRAGMRAVVRRRILEDSVEGIARSRLIARGIFHYAASIEDSRRPVTDADGNTVIPKKWGEEIVDIARRPLDPKSPFAMIPIPVGVSEDQAKAFGVIDFGTQQDERILDLLNEADEDYADSVDLPREVLLGKGDLNHWNYWGLTADEFRHLEPLADTLGDAFARAVLIPLAVALKIPDPTEIVLGYDPSDITTSPDLTEVAKWARGVPGMISNEAARRLTGLEEETDAPNEEETRRQLAAVLALGSQGLAAVTLPDLGFDPQPLIDIINAQSGATPPPENAPPPVEVETPANGQPEPPPAVTAAVTPSRSLRQMSDRWNRAEARARDRIHAAAERALIDALKRAGNKVVSRAQKLASKTNRADIQAQLLATPLEEIVRAVGKAGLRTLGLEEDELLRGAEEEFRAQVHRELTAAEREMLRALAAESPGFDADAALIRGTDDRDAAASLAAVALVALARRRLYDPSPDFDERGELAGDVPPILSAATLARAGGAIVALDAAGFPMRPVNLDTTTPPMPGLADGPYLTGLASEQLGPLTTTYEWAWGGSARPFEPHLALDGASFSAWDDPILSTPADASWIGSAFLSPLDHGGCSCSVEIAFAIGEEPLAASVHSNGRSLTKAGR